MSCFITASMSIIIITISNHQLLSQSMIILVTFHLPVLSYCHHHSCYRQTSYQPYPFWLRSSIIIITIIIQTTIDYHYCYYWMIGLVLWIILGFPYPPCYLSPISAHHSLCLRRSSSMMVFLWSASARSASCSSRSFARASSYLLWALGRSEVMGKWFNGYPIKMGVEGVEGSMIVEEVAWVTVVVCIISHEIHWNPIISYNMHLVWVSWTYWAIP